MKAEEVARLLRVHPRWVTRHIQPTLRKERLSRYLWEDVWEQLVQGDLVPDVRPRQSSRVVPAAPLAPDVVALAEELAS